MEAHELKVVGKSIPRVDVVSKLTGQAVFAEDMKLPGPMLHGRILRSPHPHALVKRVDTSKAEKLEGVRAVATAADLPDTRLGRNLRDETYFATDKVRYVGERIAAVAADTREIAEEALKLIEVDFELLEPVMDALEAMKPDAPVIHPHLMSYQVVNSAVPQGGNVCSLNSLSKGDAEAGFAQADHVFEHVYTTEMQHQAYMEPHACLGVYNADATYTVYTSNQGIFPMRNNIAVALGVPHNRVKVVGTEIGGGFGGKIVMTDEAAAALLARKSGLPVRIVMTRAEDFMCGTPRAGFHMTIKTGVSKDMRMVARTMDVVIDGGAHAMSAVMMSASIPQFAEGPYAIPNLTITSHCVYTNKANSSAFRAPGGPQTNFAMESETERIAAEMGWDSLAFRRKNLMPEDHLNLAGVAMRSVNVTETLDAAIELSGYDPRQTSLGPCRGRGLALGNWNVGGMPTGGIVKMNDDGSAHLISGVVDLTGVNTTLVQIVAEALDLPVEKVTVKTLDTDSAPHATISAGSQALKSMGTAALLAAGHVKRQLFDLAVEDLDATPERMELGEGQVRVKDEPARAVPVTKLLAKAMAAGGPVVGHGGTGAFNRMPSFCAHVADVEVDPDTGSVKLLRYCASQDAGLAINPLICVGQVQGGVGQGVGHALSEELTYSAGRPMNTGFLDYKIPSALDLPNIETVLVEKPAVEGPFGAKGIGEPPVVPVPAAIANAIYNAVGVRVTSLPITPEKLRRAIKAAGKSSAGQ